MTIFARSSRQAFKKPLKLSLVDLDEVAPVEFIDTCANRRAQWVQYTSRLPLGSPNWGGGTVGKRAHLCGRSRRTASRYLDFRAAQSYIATMTKLLDQAVEAVRRLPSDDQDDIARAIMQLAGSDLAAPVALSPEEREAIAHSKAAAARGEFATDEQVRAVWAKHGL
jgi:hypothetical protein